MARKGPFYPLPGVPAQTPKKVPRGGVGSQRRPGAGYPPEEGQGVSPWGSVAGAPLSGAPGVADRYCKRKALVSLGSARTTKDRIKSPITTKHYHTTLPCGQPRPGHAVRFFCPCTGRGWPSPGRGLPGTPGPREGLPARSPGDGAPPGREGPRGPSETLWDPEKGSWTPGAPGTGSRTRPRGGFTSTPRAGAPRYPGAARAREG